MAVRYEQSGEGDRSAFPLPITQAGLGDATGLTGIHVNRTLRKLRTSSGVTARDGIVTISDWNLLVSTDDFDAAYMLLDGPSPRIHEVPD